MINRGKTSFLLSRNIQICWKSTLAYSNKGPWFHLCPKRERLYLPLLGIHTVYHLWFDLKMKQFIQHHRTILLENGELRRARIHRTCFVGRSSTTLMLKVKVLLSLLPVAQTPLLGYGILTNWELWLLSFSSHHALHGFRLASGKINHGFICFLHPMM